MGTFVSKAVLMLLSSASLVLSQETFDVPLELNVGRTSLTVEINGEGPFQFGLDTGASGVAWVNRALVDRLNLRLADNGFRLSDGTTSTSTQAVVLDSLRFGPVTARSVIAPVLGTGPCEAGKPGVCGALGFDAFKGYLLTLDYRKRRLRIAKGSLPVADGKRVLNFLIDHGTPRISVTIGANEFVASLDSGNPSTVLLPLGLAKELSLVAPPSAAGHVVSVLKRYDLFKAELDGVLKIGDVAVERPVVYFTDMVQEPNVGRGLLQPMAVTFDIENQRVRFELPE
jgi:hypothetical protein